PPAGANRQTTGGGLPRVRRQQHGSHEAWFSTPARHHARKVSTALQPACVKSRVPGELIHLPDHGASSSRKRAKRPISKDDRVSLVEGADDGRIAHPCH